MNKMSENSGQSDKRWWVSEFGLYRYDSQDSLYEEKKAKNNKTVLVVITATVLISFLVSYVLIINLTMTERVTTWSDDNPTVTNDSVEMQKLIFLPSKQLQPPKFQRRNEPRPFLARKTTHLPTNPIKSNSSPVVATIPHIELMKGPVSIVGKFRRPKPKTNKKRKKVKHEKDTFKVSPYDVNEIIYDKPEGDYEKAKKVLNQIRQKTKIKKANEENPTKLTLDVIPMKKDDPVNNRFSPLAAQYNAMNSIQQDKAYTMFFNTNHFPQIQQRNPYDPFYSDPNYRNKFFEQTASGPSQLTVRLNLYPKKNKRKHRPAVMTQDHSKYFRRSSEDVVINQNERVFNIKTNFPYSFELPPFRPIVI